MHTSRKAVAGTLATTALLSLLAVPVASATPSTTTPCEYSTLSQFPGSWTTIRYGQVDVSFSLCGTDPSTWTASITKSQVNSTGKNTGFFIDGSSVRPVSSSNVDKTFRLEINHSSCLARIGWPCYGSGSMTKDFYIDMERTHPVIWPRNARVDDPTLRLYDTP